MTCRKASSRSCVAILGSGDSPPATPNSAQMPLQVGLKGAASENKYFIGCSFRMCLSRAVLTSTTNSSRVLAVWGSCVRPLCRCQQIVAPRHRTPICQYHVGRRGGGRGTRSAFGQNKQRPVIDRGCCCLNSKHENVAAKQRILCADGLAEGKTR